jgi:hypothetical protein
MYICKCKLYDKHYMMLDASSTFSSLRSLQKVFSSRGLVNISANCSSKRTPQRIMFPLATDASAAGCGRPPRGRTSRDSYRGHTRQPAWRCFAFADGAPARMCPPASTTTPQQTTSNMPASIAKAAHTENGNPWLCRTAGLPVSASPPSCSIHELTDASLHLLRVLAPAQGTSWR